MNKTIFSVVLSLTALISLGAGCGKQTAQNQPTQTQEKQSIFSSIKDAFDRSIALRCDYIDEDGEKTVTYIKNKRIYLESEPTTSTDGQTSVFRGLIKDDKMYIWGDTSDKGIVFDFKTIKDEPPKMGGKEIKSTQDVIDKLEEKKDKCRAESVSDDKFELPTKIQFVSF